MRLALLGFIMCCWSCISGQTTSTLPIIDFDLNSTRIGLTGNVLLPNGEPATGGIVELLAGMDPETSVTVQKDGTFALPYPNFMAGPYSVRVQDRGFATATFDLPMGRNLPTVVLRTAESIRGRITATDNTPLEDIRVVVSTVFGRRGPRGEYQKIDYKDEPPYSIHEVKKTNADGRFEFNDLTRGVYAFQAYAPELVSYTQEVETPTSSDIKITMTLATGTITGRAVQFGSNEPLPGTTVSISSTRPPAHGAFLHKSQTVLSDYNGIFIFSAVEPGYYSVTARKNNLIEIINSCNADIRTIPTAEVDVMLFSGHKVYGMARDALTSEPLAGVEVSALSIGDHDTTATTDSEGRYSLENVIVGGGNRLFLKAKKRGYAYTSTSGSGIEIPDVILTMDKLDVSLDLQMFPKGPKDYEGFFD